MNTQHKEQTSEVCNQSKAVNKRLTDIEESKILFADQVSSLLLEYDLEKILFTLRFTTTSKIIGVKEGKSRDQDPYENLMNLMDLNTFLGQISYIHNFMSYSTGYGEAIVDGSNNTLKSH